MLYIFSQLLLHVLTGGYATCLLEWERPVGSTRNVIPADAWLPIKDVHVSYYDASGWSALPTAGLSSLTPYKVDRVETIDFRSRNGDFATSGRSDYVGALFKGQLQFDDGEFVKLCLHSDDGSNLYINGSLVVDNDGLHPERTNCTDINLSGEVVVEVEYFDAGMCMYQYFEG